MGGVVAIGEPSRLAGLALAGAIVLSAEDSAGIRRAWRSLPEGVDVVILTAWAAEILGPVDDRLTVVMPGALSARRAVREP